MRLTVGTGKEGVANLDFFISYRGQLGVDGWGLLWENHCSIDAVRGLQSDEGLRSRSDHCSIESKRLFVYQHVIPTTSLYGVSMLCTFALIDSPIPHTLKPTWN